MSDYDFDDDTSSADRQLYEDCCSSFTQGKFFPIFMDEESHEVQY